LAQQVNPQWRAEELLRSGGEYDDPEIKIALDTKNYGDKEEKARAHQAIQAVQNNEKLEFFYGATTRFMQIIHDFAVNNRNTLGMAKYQKLIDYAMAHASIAQENMARMAGQVAAAVAADPNAAPEQPQPEAAAPVASPATAVRQVASQLP
jgi:hypothetical protein